jgi:hypothetical protein
MQHMKGFQQRIRTLRSTRPAKTLLLSCAIAGLHRGWTQSKTSLHGDERLFVDRFAWSALYTGLYTWGHPVVFYCLLQQLEICARKAICGDRYKHVGNPNMLKILDVPHAEEYKLPCPLKNFKKAQETITRMSADEVLQRVLRLEV